MTDARVERLRSLVEELTEERDRLLSEATDLMRERDEARKCAEQLRDMLAALDEVTAALPFPWEVEVLDADSNSKD